jgi:hypothetical protein
MKKLRLILFEKCNRSCAGCCNKGFDLAALPICTDLTSWDEIYLTGGEPMLEPGLIRGVISKIPMRTKVYLYTAKVDDVKATLDVLGALDGMTLTLHEQRDVAPFLALNMELLATAYEWSLRLNVFDGVQLPDLDLSLWQVKAGKVWVKDCPIPEGEVFMRLASAPAPGV